MNPSYLLRTLLYSVIVLSLILSFKVLVAIYSIDEDKSITKDEENAFDVLPKNDTASLDIIGKSEAVQSWLAKKQNSRTKSLSEVESSLRVDQAAQLSARRNPKFEAVDPEVERLQNQVHQFKFVQ
ncbi:unnamed protein product [Caenorhabditis nigoni]